MTRDIHISVNISSCSGLFHQFIICSCIKELLGKSGASIILNPSTTTSKRFYETKQFNKQVYFMPPPIWTRVIPILQILSLQKLREMHFFCLAHFKSMAFRHKKAKADAAKMSMFGKLSKEIAVSVRCIFWKKKQFIPSANILFCPMII